MPQPKLAIVSFVALIAAPIAAMWQIDADTEWTEFLLVIVIASAAIYFFSTEWSRRWLLAACALALLLVVVYLAKIGVVTERIETFDRRIVETIDEREELLTAASEAFDEDETKLDTAAEETKSQLVQLLGEKDSSSEMAARDLVLLLTTRPLNETDQADAEIKLDQFLDYLTSAELSLYRTTQLRDSAANAVVAFTDTATQASTEALDLAIKTVCAHAEAAGADSCREFQGGSPGDSERDLHALDVALASYRFAVTGSDTDEATRDSLIAAGPQALEILDWKAGAGAFEALLDQLAGGNPIHLVPGPIGWALVAFALILGLRVLLRRNANQYAGPVQIEYSGDSKEQLSIAVFNNLPTPAAAPGAPLAQSITDLSSIEPNTRTLATIVKAITDALAPPQGYVISADLAKPPTEATSPTEKASEDSTTAEHLAGDGADGETDSTRASKSENTRVLVRITSAADKTSIAAKTFIDPEPAAAMQSAGLWAAGLLLSRSTRVPTWATWNEETAQALNTVSLGEEPTLEELEQALRTAPSSGIMLQQFGNRLELNERELDAVNVYARAVAAHPRYLVARYRLGVAIGMLANNPESWRTATPSRRDAILAGLLQAATATDTPPGNIDNLKKRPTLAADDLLTGDLRKVATDFLDRLRCDLSWLRRPSASLRRSDRDNRWNLQNQSNDPPRHRQWRLKYLAKFAARVYGKTTEPLKKRDKWAMRNPKAGWQLMYNEACRNTTLGEYATALDLLDECLTRPHVEQLQADWVRKDSDLAALRNQPRFQRFTEQLEGIKAS